MVDRERFRFVQIGANDGKTNDPIGHIVRRRALRGHVIEPVPSAYEQLRSHYAGTACVCTHNVAIGTEAGLQSIYLIGAQFAAGRPDGNATSVSSFDREHVLRAIRQWRIPHKYGVSEVDVLETLTVSVLTLHEFLTEQNLSRVDLYVIDTEGYDLAILKQIDFVRTRPKVVFYEHAHLGRAGREEAWAHLRESGFENYADNFNTFAFSLDRG
jgi:FkbM family methyltransferase